MSLSFFVLVLRVHAGGGGGGVVYMIMMILPFHGLSATTGQPQGNHRHIHSDHNRICDGENDRKQQEAAGLISILWPAWHGH